VLAYLNLIDCSFSFANIVTFDLSALKYHVHFMDGLSAQFEQVATFDYVAYPAVGQRTMPICVMQLQYSAFDFATCRKLTSTQPSIFSG